MEYSSVGAGFRVVILLLLVAVLVLGGLVWFDYLGIVDAQGLLSPVFTLIRGEKVAVDVQMEPEEEGRALGVQDCKIPSPNTGSY